MSVQPDVLEDLWATLKISVAGRLAAQRIPGLAPERPIYVARDEDGRRFLLIAVAEGDVSGIKKQTTRALDVSPQSLIVSGAPETSFLVLLCRGAEYHDVFTAFAAEVVEHVAARKDVAKATGELLERWRRFWDVSGRSLSTEKAIGLFGELWFLWRWLAPLEGVGLDGWMGWDESLHDFQWPTASVEVKTCAARSGPLVHRIGRIEQLDPPSQGALFLFSLRITEDRLAANSLASLVDSILDVLGRSSSLAGDFLDRLANYGYVPLRGEVQCQPYRILSEGLYRVDPNFPRLSASSFKAGIPSAVKDISYSLDLDACAEWVVLTGPEGLRSVLGLAEP